MLNEIMSGESSLGLRLLLESEETEVRADGGPLIAPRLMSRTVSVLLHIN